MMKRNLLTATAFVASIGGGSMTQAGIIDVNLTRSGAPTEFGFTNWESADNGLPSDLSLAGLTLSAPSTGINAGTTLRSIDRGGDDDYEGTLPSLTQTWWSQRQGSTTVGGFFTIDISGLAAGNYTFTSWHLDHHDQSGQMKIEFSNNDGASFSDAVSEFDLVSVTDNGATAPVVKSFNFTSTGADIQFRFRNTGGVLTPPQTAASGVFPVVNGFIIDVPEPSSLALLAAGGLLMLRRNSAQVARRRCG